MTLRGARVPPATTRLRPFRASAMLGSVKTGRTKRWARTGLIPIVFLLLSALELGLRFAGCGVPPSFFLRSRDGAFLEPNEGFQLPRHGWDNGARPALFRVPVRKAPGAIRVFVLGESAAAGTPDPSCSLARLLECGLRRALPTRTVEVYNAAMRGIDSHLMLEIARECAWLEPDALVVFAGNNDAVGLHAPAPGGSRLAVWRPALRLSLRARCTRVGQWIRTLAGPPSLSRGEQDMDFFRRMRMPHDDPRRAMVRANFEANLEDVCDAGCRAAAVILATVPVNLRDCPPLGSMHRADLGRRAEWDAAFRAGVAAQEAGRTGEAIAHYREALALDDHHAELHFRLAECLDAAGDAASARRHFELARDRDALPFRTDGAMNDLIRGIAARRARANVRLADVERDLAASPLAERGVPGRRLFFEHVHPTFEGSWEIARSIYPALLSALAPAPGKGAPAPPPFPSPDECRAYLGFTPWDELDWDASMVRVTGSPPFLDQAGHARRQAEAEESVRRRTEALPADAATKTLEVCSAAVARRPDDADLREKLGLLLLRLHRGPEAADLFGRLASEFTRRASLRLCCARAFVVAGRPADGFPYIRDAMRLAPWDAQAREAGAWMEDAMKRPAAPAP